jgi:hypothetical protein
MFQAMDQTRMDFQYQQFEEGGYRKIETDPIFHP